MLGDITTILVRGLWILSDRIIIHAVIETIPKAVEADIEEERDARKGSGIVSSLPELTALATSKIHSGPSC